MTNDERIVEVVFEGRRFLRYYDAQGRLVRIVAAPYVSPEPSPLPPISTPAPPRAQAPRDPGATPAKAKEPRIPLKERLARATERRKRQPEDAAAKDAPSASPEPDKSPGAIPKSLLSRFRKDEGAQPDTPPTPPAASEKTEAPPEQAPKPEPEAPAPPQAPPPAPPAPKKFVILSAQPALEPTPPPPAPEPESEVAPVADVEPEAPQPEAAAPDENPERVVTLIPKARKPDPLVALEAPTASAEPDAVESVTDEASREPEAEPTPPSEVAPAPEPDAQPDPEPLREPEPEVIAPEPPRDETPEPEPAPQPAPEPARAFIPPRDLVERIGSHVDAALAREEQRPRFPPRVQALLAKGPPKFKPIPREPWEERLDRALEAHQRA